MLVRFVVVDVAACLQHSTGDRVERTGLTCGSSREVAMAGRPPVVTISTSLAVCTHDC